LGGDTVAQPCLCGWEEEAPGGHGRLGDNSGLGRRAQGATFAPTRAGAPWDGGCGIPGETSDGVRGICRLIARRSLVAEGVGCGDVFCGGLWATCGG